MVEGFAQDFVIQETPDNDEWFGEVAAFLHGPFTTYALALKYAHDELGLPTAGFLVRSLVPPRYKVTASHIHPDQTTIDDYITNPDSGC